MRPIKKLVYKFRQIIVDTPTEFLPIRLKNFPTGSCGDTCLLLAEYLSREDEFNFNYVCGERNGSSHAWLERGALIIDITANQFDDCEEVMIVTSKKSDWHKTFKIIGKHPASLNFYDKYTQKEMQDAYNSIINREKRILIDNTI